ncbi:MAG TPA: DUF3000 family protein [Streptosporangiaceae bacterium]
MPEDRHVAVDAFTRAVAQLEAGIALTRQARPEISFDSEPPPRRLAPQAAAIAATVEAAGDEIGWGRFVLLYDPAGQDGWAGPFRVIAYVRAVLEPEIAADPLIGQVGWSWLIEALDATPASYAVPSGTVTRVVTEGFGSKSDEPVATEFELRASWSPQSSPPQSPAPQSPPPQSPGSEDFELDRHVAAWADALCIASGLPPVTPGVAQLRPPALRQPRPRRRS